MSTCEACGRSTPLCSVGATETDDIAQVCEDARACQREQVRRQRAQQDQRRVQGDVAQLSAVLRLIEVGNDVIYMTDDDDWFYCAPSIRERWEAAKLSVLKPPLEVP